MMEKMEKYYLLPIRQIIEHPFQRKENAFK